VKTTLLRHTIALLAAVFPALHATAQDHTIPPLQGEYGPWAEALRDAIIVVHPEKDAPEYWAGAPSVARGEDGTIWLACRMRSPEAPRGQRGHSLRLLRSADGIKFDDALTIKRDAVPVDGFERPALLVDPKTKKFKLYGCGAWEGGPWSIFKLDDAADPAKFDPATARRVIAPLPTTGERDVLPVEYKDPVIFHDGQRFHAYVIGYLRKNERIYHFTSTDGETWQPQGNPYVSLLPLAGWHDFFVRPAAVIPAGLGWLFLYEGSHSAWHDPVYNIATGLAFTFDLHTLQDLTPDAPLWLSPTPGPNCATLRYATALQVEKELWVYAETARPNDAHDIRLLRLPPYSSAK